jgi:hypothetical protein
MNGYDGPRGTQKASKIADCLRCNFLPECYMASTEVRERHRTLRYRELLVRQNVQFALQGLAEWLSGSAREPRGEAQPRTDEHDSIR